VLSDQQQIKLSLIVLGNPAIPIRDNAALCLLDSDIEGTILKHA
jgi:hypothetical protein